MNYEIYAAIHDKDGEYLRDKVIATTTEEGLYHFIIRKARKLNKDKNTFVFGRERAIKEEE